MIKSTFKAARLTNLDLNLLLDESTKQWNLDIMQQLIAPHQWALVLATLISFFNSTDSFVWRFTKSGIFSVKSAYRLARILNHDEAGASQFHVVNGFSGDPTVDRHEELKVKLNRRLWKLDVPPKITLFLWKILQGALPLNSRRAIFIKESSPLCAFCNSEFETESHLFFFCEVSRAVWFGSQLGVLASNFQSGNLEQIIWDLLTIKGRSVVNSQRQVWRAVATLWLLWKNRCDTIFRDHNFLHFWNCGPLGKSLSSSQIKIARVAMSK